MHQYFLVYPSIKLAPSNNAVIGRYILPKTIFKKLSNLKPGKGGVLKNTVFY